MLTNIILTLLTLTQLGLTGWVLYRYSKPSASSHEKTTQEKLQKLIEAMETTISNLSVRNHHLTVQNDRLRLDKEEVDLALIRLEQEARRERERMHGEVSVLLKNKNKYRDQNRELRNLIRNAGLGAELPDPVEESYPGTKPLKDE